MTDDKISGREFIEAVAKAMNMPTAGVRGLTIEVIFPGPVLVTFDYQLEGKRSLVEMPILRRDES